MVYRVELKPAAEHDLRRLPRRDQKRIARKIDAVAQDPRPPGVKKLKGAQALWRIRAGDYRILYQIRDEVKIVVVARIRHRREVYEQL